MNHITYLWKFKPDENQPFPLKVIRHNAKYIRSYHILTPSYVEPFLDNDVFPELRELYKSIPKWVIQSDVARLLAVYFQGGFYFDADCFIKKPFHRHTDAHNLLLFTEHICPSIHHLGPRESKHPDNVLRVANYGFGARTVKHPFLKEVINECIARLKQLLVIENKTTNLSHEDILWVCGPDVITTVYHQLKHIYGDLFLYDTSYLEHRCQGSWR
jgi:mannosyltransferase OCH1-like enzyme